MPALVTKTIRLKQTQDEELRSKYKDRSSFLFRELFRIFCEASLPGTEILKLRSQMKLSDEDFKRLEE